MMVRLHTKKRVEPSSKTDDEDGNTRKEKRETEKEMGRLCGGGCDIKRQMKQTTADPYRNGT